MKNKFVQAGCPQCPECSQVMFQEKKAMRFGERWEWVDVGGPFCGNSSCARYAAGRMPEY